MIRRFLGWMVLLASTSAFAKVSLKLPYPFEIVWPAALRFVRLDRGWKVSDQDKEAGFFRFDLIQETKRNQATLELVRITDGEGRDSIRAQLSTSSLPRYQELPILEALDRKIREEQGPPTPPKRPKKEEPKEHVPHDGGADAPRGPPVLIP